MPSSSYSTIPIVLDIVTTIKPKSILDIGMGTGKYGMLFREYLDVWNTATPYKERGVQIDGVEIFEEYRNPVWDVYDNIYVGDALEIPEICEKKYDLLFMCDVIEHLTPEQAVALFDRLKYEHIIIVTPKSVTAQDEVYGNPYEKHISAWDEESFENLQCQVIDNAQIFFNRYWKLNAN